MASVHPIFGTTLAQHLNQSYVSAMLLLNLIATEFGMAEAQGLNWALVFMSFKATEKKAAKSQMQEIWMT